MMIKSIALVHIVLWGGLFAGGLLRVPAQFERLIIQRTEVPTNAD